MIIQAHGATALLITQPDHAALAGRIMSHWKHGGFHCHPRHRAILRAVAEHDNGWREVDSAPALDPANGRMLDFVNVPADVRRAIWPRGVERLRADPWVAALVAQHAIHVYRHYREDLEWATFFSQLEALRNELVDRAATETQGLQLDDLLADYFFVRMGDLLSLTFCNAWSDAPDELGYHITCHDRRLTVTPDPFEGRELPLDVPARELPNREFGSPADAARAFGAASTFSYRGVVRGESAA